MSGKLAGKVAFITGIGRGQGRSHALRLASEGADIIGLDICDDIATIPYGLSTKDDLAETVRLVEELGRKIVASVADVRDAGQVTGALDAGLSELGRVDIVLANAGVSAIMLDEADPAQMFRDSMEVNAFGVYNTVHAAAPHMIEGGRGGSIVVTSSTMGLTGRGGTGSGGQDGYVASKHAVVGLMRAWAHWLAPHNIRVNSIHPSGVATPLVENEALMGYINANPQMMASMTNLIEMDLLAPGDVSNAIAWLVSDEARYLTGVTLPIDGGFLAK